MSIDKRKINRSAGALQRIACAVTVALALSAVPSFGITQVERVRRATEPTLTPTPTPAPASAQQTASSPVSRARAPRTLVELQSQIAEIAHQPELEPGFFAVKIASLDTGVVIYEQNAHKFVRPASNMKLYTVAAALDRLTPDYHFVTSVYAPEKPDKSGTLKDDLIVYGRGDPSIAARFNNGDYFKGINDLADRIVAAGVKRIKGDLVGDESYFHGAPLGGGWEWEDLQWSYGAEVSALTVNDNAVDLTVRSGAKVGAPCVVTTGPPATFMTIANRAITAARGSKSYLQVYRGLGANTLEITGSIPLGDNGFSGSVAVPDPALAFISMVRDALAKRGVAVGGRLRTVNARSGDSVIPNGSKAGSRSPEPPSLRVPVEIASLPSPPFSVIAAHTLKPSQNLYTELILRTLGQVNLASDTGKDTSHVPAEPGNIGNITNEQAGLEVVKSFLRQAGVSEGELELNDGSGLSRNDMITANATVELLTFMSKHRYFSAFRDALPIAGVDGTLRGRMRGTPAEGNVRAKTGTLSSVASLSGYVTTAAGEHLVFSMMLNNFADAGAVRQNSIDAIAILLASFSGKSQ